MRGADVIVWRAVTDADRYGQPVSTWKATRAHNVLFAPLAGVTATADDTSLGAGDENNVTFDFPKSWREPLSGCVIETRDVRGVRMWWSVIGDPQPYMVENTPGPWNLHVRAIRRSAAPPRDIEGANPWLT